MHVPLVTYQDERIYYFIIIGFKVPSTNIHSGGMLVCLEIILNAFKRLVVKMTLLSQARPMGLTPPLRLGLRPH